MHPSWPYFDERAKVVTEHEKPFETGSDSTQNFSCYTNADTLCDAVNVTNYESKCFTWYRNVGD